MLTLPREYWDGKNISPLTADDRNQLLTVYERWDLEDFDVVAFGYTPVPMTVKVDTLAPPPPPLLLSSQHCIRVAFSPRTKEASIVMPLLLLRGSSLLDPRLCTSLTRALSDSLMEAIVVTGLLVLRVTQERPNQEILRIPIRFPSSHHQRPRI